MKLHTALLTLTLLGQSRGQCPAELTGVEAITSTLTMYYALVLSDSEPGIFCARFESQSEAWLGWGINPSGEMIGAESVIGLPDEGTVRKYNLFDESMDGVVEMDEASQTLMETSIVQENGMTIMSFAKYLDEDQYGIFESGSPNSFIWAVGSSNALGYHADRGNFQLEFESAAGSSTSSSVASVTTPPFVTTIAGNATEGFIDGVITVAPTPTATENSTGMPDAAFGTPTYSPTVVDVTTPPTSNGEALTASTSAVPNATVGVALNETDSEEYDYVTTSSTIAQGANVQWSTPSPTPALSEGDVATPSPSVVSNSSVSAEPTAAATETPTSNSTAESTESSTSNSTAPTTESSTSNTTSNSTQNGNQSNGESQYSPGDFASGAGSSASKETASSAMSSHNIGGLVVGVAALAVAFGF